MKKPVNFKRVIIAALAFISMLPQEMYAAEQDSLSVMRDTIAEAGIIESRVTRQADRNVYTILPSDRLKSYDINSLLDRLPGIKYDGISDRLTVNGYDAIVFVMDGVEISKEELKALSPEQIRSISIIHTPKGKYISRGIRYVIEIRRKRDDGIFMNVRNSLFITPENSRTIANEQPGIALQYTKGRFDMNTGYGFGDILWNYENTAERRMPDGREYSINPDYAGLPTERYRYTSHNAYLRTSYSFNDRHTLSVFANYSREGTNTANSLYMMEKASGTTFHEFSQRQSSASNWTASATYNGMLSDRLAMNISVNWNGIYTPETYTFLRDGTVLENSVQNSRKDYSFQNIDLTYSFSDRFSLNFGMNGTYNRYRISDTGTGSTVFDRISGRADLYAYATWGIRDDLALSGGLSAGYVKDGAADRFYAAPMLTLNYFPKSVFGLTAVYNADPSYPVQEQLDPTLHQTGEFLYSQGNPGLPPMSLTHSLLIQMSFWNNLQFINYLTFTPDYISDYYALLGNNVISTYTTAGYFRYTTGLEYKWEISKNWAWNNSVQMNLMKISGGGLRNSEIGFMGESELEYFSPKLKLLSSLGYSRGMSRIPGLQGFSEYGFDLWNLTVGKYLLKDRLVLSLDYVIPLNIGVRQSQKSETVTPFYFQRNALDLGIYDNMLIFRLTFRFGKGKETKEIRDNTRYDNEILDKRGLL